MKTKSLSTISLMDRPRVQAREEAVHRTSWPCEHFPGSASFISPHMTLEMVKAFSLRFDTVLMNRGPLVLPALFIHANKAFTGQILGSELNFFITAFEGLLPDLWF